MGYDQDHGYFGKGLDGYVHYKQVFDPSSRSSGGGPGPERRLPDYGDLYCDPACDKHFCQQPVTGLYRESRFLKKKHMPAHSPKLRLVLENCLHMLFIVMLFFSYPIAFCR